MKALILIAILAVSPVTAAQYEGKKFKVVITKDKATGERTIEGEVWDTTRSEHTLILHTAPVTAQPTQSVAPVEPLDSRWNLK